MALKRSTVRFRYAPVPAPVAEPGSPAGQGRRAGPPELWIIDSPRDPGSRKPGGCRLREAPRISMSLTGQDLAVACARAAEKIQAEKIRVLDLREISSLTDFMVICSGSSMPHLRAVLRDVEKDLREEFDARPLYVDGKADSRWVVLDYVDVMVHIMHDEMREHYGLEDLWGDARTVEWEES